MKVGGEMFVFMIICVGGVVDGKYAEYHVWYVNLVDFWGSNIYL